MGMEIEISFSRFGCEKVPQQLQVGEETLSTEGLKRRRESREGSMWGGGEDRKWHWLLGDT